MKKFLLSVILAGAALTAGAQTCNELFISEYVEGTYNNKAVEIYNPTGQAVDLSNYRLIRWDNGNTTPAANEILPLPSTMLASKDVYVIVINTQDVGTDTVPFADLVAKADVQLCTSCDPNSGSLRTLCFNGDDALSLQKNDGNGNWTNVDIFGLIGERPTNGNGTNSPTGAWTDQAPYSSRPVAIPSNVYFLYFWTQDKTMIRKSTVTSGQSTNPGIPYTGAWNPATQWDTLPENTFTQLGTHACDCNTVGVNENPQGFSATLFPNPAADVVNVRLSENIKNVQVYNVAGQLVKTITATEPSVTTKFDTHGLNAGMYLVKVETVKGHTAVKKLTIQ